jgi:hypothetical protein
VDKGWPAELLNRLPIWIELREIIKSLPPKPDLSKATKDWLWEQFAQSLVKGSVLIID